MRVFRVHYRWLGEQPALARILLQDAEHPAERPEQRGIGTLAQFDAWLQAQGFGDFDRTVLLRPTP